MGKIDSFRTISVEFFWSHFLRITKLWFINGLFARLQLPNI